MIYAFMLSAVFLLSIGLFSFAFLDIARHARKRSNENKLNINKNTD